MKMTILNAFHDKYRFSTIYKVGQVAEFDGERAQDLIERGLATPVEVEEKKVDETEHVASEEIEEPTNNAESAEEPSKSVEPSEEPKRRGRKPKGE